MKPPKDVQDWQELAAEAARLKALELDARLKLAAKYFPGAEDGTSTLELGKGWVLAAVVKSSFRLDSEAARLALAQICAADPAGTLIAERLVKWSAELRVGEWKKLPPKLARIIAKALTITPATPSLELRPPKAAG